MEKLIYFFIITLLIVNFYFFLDLILPPKIKIISPKEKEVFYDEKVVFKGYADKRGDLFINEVPVYFDENGYFEKEFYLKEGLNKFIIREVKFWGQETKIERSVFYIKK